MRKLFHISLVLCGIILGNTSLGNTSQSTANKGIDGLLHAENLRVGAISSGHEHLPHTYDILQRLCKVDPRVTADELQTQIIARSVIANALLINNFNILLTQYINRHLLIGYFAISALALNLQETSLKKENDQKVMSQEERINLIMGKYISVTEEQKNHLAREQKNHLARSQSSLLVAYLNRFYSLTVVLFEETYDRIKGAYSKTTKPQKIKENNNKIQAGSPGGSSIINLPPLPSFNKIVMPLAPRPKVLWEGYPKFYRGILQKIKEDKEDEEGKKVQQKIARLRNAIDTKKEGKWGNYNDLNSNNKLYSEVLIDEIYDMGLSIVNVDTLMDMWSLEVPESIARWEQIKKQGKGRIR